MKYVLIYIINFYRRYLTMYKPPACKYYPNCSDYAIDAIKKKGPLIGIFKIMWRLLRCNPFSKGGYDPVI